MPLKYPEIKFGQKVIRVTLGFGWLTYPGLIVSSGWLLKVVISAAVIFVVWLMSKWMVELGKITNKNNYFDIMKEVLKKKWQHRFLVAMLILTLTDISLYVLLIKDCLKLLVTSQVKDMSEESDDILDISMILAVYMAIMIFPLSLKMAHKSTTSFNGINVVECQLINIVKPKIKHNADSKNTTDNTTERRIRKNKVRICYYMIALLFSMSALAYSRSNKSNNNTDVSTCQSIGGCQEFNEKVYYDFPLTFFSMLNYQFLLLPSSHTVEILKKFEYSVKQIVPYILISGIYLSAAYCFLNGDNTVFFLDDLKGESSCDYTIVLYVALFAFLFSASHLRPASKAMRDIILPDFDDAHYAICCGIGALTIIFSLNGVTFINGTVITVCTFRILLYVILPCWMASKKLKYGKLPWILITLSVIASVVSIMGVFLPKSITPYILNSSKWIKDLLPLHLV